MHWLEEEVNKIDQLMDAHPRTRSACRAALGDLVAQVVDRAGVAACFACHDGLLVACAGGDADFEALAAVAQACLDAGRRASSALTLGRVQQVLVVGEARKLALVATGPIAIGVLAPVEVPLAQRLA